MEAHEIRAAMNEHYSIHPMDAVCGCCNSTWGEHRGDQCPGEKTTFKLAPTPDADGWIAWNGGAECPVHAKTAVEVRYRNGEFLQFVANEIPAWWRHMGDGFDVLAYRVTEPAKANHESDCAQHNAPALPVGPCDCNAAMIARDGPARSREPRLKAESVSSVKPAIAGLTITRDMRHQLAPSFGSALI